MEGTLWFLLGVGHFKANIRVANAIEQAARSSDHKASNPYIPCSVISSCLAFFIASEGFLLPHLSRISLNSVFLWHLLTRAEFTLYEKTFWIFFLNKNINLIKKQWFITLIGHRKFLTS